MEEMNREQIEFWNGAPGRRWVTHQESLDRVWGPLGDLAIERATVARGERVVDIGCGCGATALELAEKVGPSGSVLGIDISAPMLARAQERRQMLGLANLEFVQADASSYVFANHADLVFSRAGVMFFATPSPPSRTSATHSGRAAALSSRAFASENSTRGGPFHSRRREQ
jgi:SAM-dependent methyltransferase